MISAKAQGHQLAPREEMAVLINAIQCIQQRFTDTQLPCQGSMRSHSVKTMIDL